MPPPSCRPRTSSGVPGSWPRPWRPAAAPTTRPAASARDAIDRFSEAAAPYEGALARVELARALLGLGRDDAAAVERDAAAETFARLGAVRDKEQAQQVTQPGGEDLSDRELEVLRLVAQGLSDADIAARLVLSKHTVHRHVANIRVKLRQPSRAAAVACAARTGLL